jgi:S-DNA-T family DNA segregation ATPase FtsK/SpoIIIE
MRDVATPTFERQLVQLRGGDEDEQRIVESKNNSSASLAAAQEDPMFDRAVEIVLESKRGSVSLLQRRLAIGYTRASRLIDLMGIAGIIGEHKGSVAREVVITLEDWETMKRLADEEARRLGITKGLFDGSGEGDGGPGPAGAPRDLGGIDQVGDAPVATLQAAADLDMDGISADAAGPIIGGRPKGESDEVDLDGDDEPPARPADSPALGSAAASIEDAPFDADEPAGRGRGGDLLRGSKAPLAKPDSAPLGKAVAVEQEGIEEAGVEAADDEVAEAEPEEDDAEPEDQDADAEGASEDDEYEYEYEYVEVEEEEDGKVVDEAEGDSDDVDVPEVNVRKPGTGAAEPRRKAG